MRYVRLLGQAVGLVPAAIVGRVDRVILNAHAPIEVDGLPYCTNHWGHRLTPWPCKETLRVTDRWDKRNATLKARIDR